MDLVEIRISDTSEEQIIVLRERGGNRILPIVIGIHEAYAIDRRVKGQRHSRPMTHDLLENVIDALSAELEKIVINDIQSRTYFSKLVLRNNGEVVEVDSRPSDAIALGVSTETPIYVEEHVLRDALQQRTE